jgi:hypothetical protein
MKVTDPWKRLLAAVAAGGMYVSGAAHAANLNTNLVVNPGFENVVFGPTGAYGAPQILDWTAGTLQGFAYSHDLSGGVPDYANGGPLAGGGSFYFSANAAPGNVNINAAGQVSQDVDVSAGPSGTLIATGNAAYKISGFFSSYLAQGDFGSLYVDFRNSSNVSLGNAVVSDNDTSTWSQNFRGGAIPVGTATVRVSVFGTAFSGGPDGYIDNVDFQVTNEIIQPTLGITVNRDTGGLTLFNQTGGAVNIKSYSITSAFEALDPANWLSIADNYDAGSPGPNQVDAAHNWSELTDPTANGDLSEADLQSADGAALAHTRTVNLGTSAAWIRNPTEDLVFQYISGSQIVQGLVLYTGHGGVPFVTGDLNTDGAINTADWTIFRTNQQTNLTSKSLAEAYRLGDLTGDRLNDHADFVLFKTAYDAANGTGAFVAMLAAVPEPSSVLLVLTAGLFSLPLRRRVAAGD